jgi:hypothetical protein
MTSQNTPQPRRLTAVPAPGQAPAAVISPAVAARIHQLAGQAEHRRNIAGFHGRHLADQQARINALRLEMIDALAGSLAAPPGNSWPVPAAPHQEVKSFQCPSETTSTLPPVTLMAVWSSIAYVGAGILAAHCSAMAMSW